MTNYPAVLDVEEFVSSRRQETETLLTALAQGKSGQRSFQKLHFSWRRRAQSHNPFRIPLRCRAPILRDFATAPPLPSKRPRKDRRKPHNISKEFARRSDKCEWLETHLWHAKRMHMGEFFGFKIAKRPTQKCLRKVNRYSRRRCVMFDRSYFSLISAEGDPDAILAGLKPPAASLSPSRDRRAEENYETGTFVLCDGKEVLGPISYIIRRQKLHELDSGKGALSSSASASERASCGGGIWLLSHPLLTGRLQDSLRRQEVSYSTLERLSCFELFGPQSLHCLSQLDCPAFRQFRTVQSVDYFVNDGKLFCTEIKCPKLLGPFPAKPSVIPNSSNSNLKIPPLRLDHPFWPEAEKEASTDETFRLTRRSTRRRPASQILIKAQAVVSRHEQPHDEEVGAADESSPLLADEPLQPVAAPSRKPTETRTINALLHLKRCGDLPRVLLFIPRGSGARSVWTLLAKFGCMAIGLEDRCRIHAEASVPHFPDHWSLSPDGKDWLQEKMRVLSDAHQRRPTAKRRPLDKLEHPFGFSWPPDAKLASSPSHSVVAVLSAALQRQELTSGGDLTRVYVPVIVEVPINQAGLPRDNATLWLINSSVSELSQVDQKTSTYAGFVSSGGHSLLRGAGKGLGFVSLDSLSDALRRLKDQEIVKRRRWLERLGTSTSRLNDELLLRNEKVGRLFSVRLLCRSEDGRGPAFVDVLPSLKL